MYETAYWNVVNDNMDIVGYVRRSSYLDYYVAYVFYHAYLYKYVFYKPASVVNGICAFGFSVVDSEGEFFNG